MTPWDADDMALICRAAERYGLAGKHSPDRLLLKRWPHYHTDAIHTRGYHAMCDAIMAIVDSRVARRVCKACSKRLSADTPKNRRYCNDACKRQGLRRHVETKACLLCDGEITRHQGESGTRWIARKYCPTCARLTNRRKPTGRVLEAQQYMVGDLGRRHGEAA